MKAAVLYANQDLRYADWPTPEVTPGTVKVKVKMTGICGSDVPRVLANGAHYYPIVLGHEFSGVVEEVGEGVTNVKPGDTVSGAPLLPCMACADCQQGNFSLCKHYGFIGSHDQGSFAEYVVMPARNAIPFDPSVSFEQAALFEPSTVAVHGLLQNDVRGGTVAVIGGGTIGAFTLQWAKIFGAKTVTLLDIDDDRLALGKRLGADFTVNSASPDYAERAKALTGGRGFDAVFVTSGAAATMYMGFTLAANKARVCCIGTPTSDLTFTPQLWEQMNRKEFTLTGSWMSYSAPFPGKEWELTAHCFADGRLQFDEELIFRKYPMSRAAEAFALYQTPGLVKGKILLYND